jgi:hypothetical protein
MMTQGQSGEGVDSLALRRDAGVLSPSAGACMMKLPLVLDEQLAVRGRMNDVAVFSTPKYLFLDPKAAGICMRSLPLGASVLSTSDWQDNRRLFRMTA